MRKVRTIEIWEHEDFNQSLEDENVSRDVVNAALGQLARWAIGSEKYSHVVLGCDREGNIDATYYDSDKKEKVTYEIGGILRLDGEIPYYSFHS